jgi:TIR domain
MTASDTSYDVFISYSHADATWVREWLQPRLEAAGLRICIDWRNFDVGVPSLINMERAVDHSRHTLLVLTPSWVASEWTDFEELLTQTTDPAARRRRLIPLLLQPCQPPRRIAMLTYADFTQQAAWETELRRVIAAVRGELHFSDLGPPLHQQPPQSREPRNRQGHSGSDKGWWRAPTLIVAIIAGLAAIIVALIGLGAPKSKSPESMKIEQQTHGPNSPAVGGVGGKVTTTLPPSDK